MIANDYIEDWAERTERIVGGVMKKQKLKFSDPSKENISISVQDQGQNTKIEIMFRTSLRFVDMGAGRGYHKGVRINRGAYLDATSKGRLKKPILNKPIYGRIAKLKDVLSANIIDNANLIFKK